MKSKYIFSQQQTDPINYYYFKDGLDNDDIFRINEESKNLPWQIAVTGKSKNEKMRMSSIKWLPQEESWGWLYSKLGDMATLANKAMWNFDLYNMPEEIQYTEYKSPSGHYDWHTDVGREAPSSRKVSLTIQLSDPDEYEGGNLEMFTAGSSDGPFTRPPNEKGTVVVFPSYILHRVTPVTSGTRKSLVLWLGGGHFR